MMANQLNRVFSAMGDPTRRSIVERLASGPASVTELARPHDMALPSFLRHVRVLEACGLVRSAKEGRTRVCRLSAQPLQTAQSWLMQQCEAWERRTDRLAYLAESLTKENSK